MTGEIRQPECLLLFSITKMGACGTRSIAGVPVHVNDFFALKPSLTLYLWTILPPGAASNSEEDTSQVLFTKPFPMCCTYSDFLDGKVHIFSRKLWNPSIACWKSGITVHLFYKETETFCCCPIKIMTDMILKNQAGGVKVHESVCALHKSLSED